MSVAHETLPLSIRELQRTREPLERATALPQAAFTDPRVLDWELEHVFMGGWIGVGHVDQVRERGDYLMVELGRESVLRRRRRRRRAARLPEHLPPPRRAHRPGARGPAPAPAVPVPRLVLRLRRLAAQRAAHRRDRGLRPACYGLRAVRAGRRRGHRHDRPVRRPRRAPDEHVGDMAPAAGALPARRACAARSGSSTTSTPTGRRSPRTTASACTARACTPSSTGSATTSRARRSSGAGAWCGGSMTLARRREHDGPRRRRPRAARRSTGVTEDDQRSVLYFLLFPNTLDLAAPRLRDAPHAVAARARPHRGRVRVVLRARDDAGRRTSTRPTRSASGTRSTARTGTSASSPSSGMASRALRARPLHERRRATCTRST